MNELWRVDKAFAYITNGDRLLVFSHTDFPEAGIQVPAGTVEPGETPAEAVMREAFEETGLEGLVLLGPLGEQEIERIRDGERQMHHRYFFHLRCEGTPPETWQHGEAYDTPGPIRFDFFWARLPNEVPFLIADHGFFLRSLMWSLGLPVEE